MIYFLIILILELSLQFLDMKAHLRKFHKLNKERQNIYSLLSVELRKILIPTRELTSIKATKVQMDANIQC